MIDNEILQTIIEDHLEDFRRFSDAVLGLDL